MGDRDRSVLIRFFVGLAAIIVIVILAWFIFFRENSDSKKNDDQTSKPSSSQSAQSGDAGSKASPKPTTSQSNNQPSGSNQSPAATGTPNKELVKTGPASILPIFIGATVIGTVAHVLYRRKAFVCIR